MARRKVDHTLKLFTVPVNFKSRKKGIATAEGNAAAWTCCCKNKVVLIGRCYFQFGDFCHTICPDCNRKYRVIGRRPNINAGKKTVHVNEI